jgi:hypothetical protein
VSASCVGYFSGTWYLSVNSAREAEITITGRQSKQRRFTLTTEQWAAFRQALENERFFWLADDYGNDAVVDGSTTTLTVALGGATKTVRYHDLGMPGDSTPEVARALRVLHLVRGWFSDPEAVDLRPYEQPVIDAAEAASGESK